MKNQSTSTTSRSKIVLEQFWALKAGAPLAAGIDHDVYSHQIEASPEIKQALAADLQD